MAASRRTHKKSRAGCAVCKRRRVKCDEVRPHCGNCFKHRVACSYDILSKDGEGRLSSPALSGHGGALPTPSPSLRDAPHSLSQSPSVGSLSSCGAGAASLFDVQAISLMHHFTISTSLTISENPAVQRLWSHQVPLLGRSFPFVLHAILAVAALHMYSLSGDTSLILTGVSHHDAAVRAMSHHLASISPDNCDALFVASSLTVIYSLVSSRPKFRMAPADPDTHLASWVPLLRGVHTILKQAEGMTSRDGPLKDRLTRYTSPPTTTLDHEPRINELYRLCTDRELPGAAELDDIEVSTAYFVAIAALQRSYAGVQEGETNVIESIFKWPLAITDRFVELVAEKRPRALVIYAHFCVLGREVKFWWAHGSADWELARVEEYIGTQWSEWLEWPKKRLKNSPGKVLLEPGIEGGHIGDVGHDAGGGLSLASNFTG